MAAAGEDGREHLCGIGPLRPDFLQKLADVRTVVVALSTLSFLNSMIQYGYFNGVVSSIEKQLGISSSRSGLIKSSKDIAEVSVVLFIGYLGAKGNRMVLTGTATLLAGVGLVMMSVPHFLIGLHHNTADDNQTARMCRVQNVTSPIDTGDSCVDENSGQENPLIYFLFVGMGLSGLLNCALQTSGMSYMDDHASTRSAPLYMGIISATGSAAAAVGFLLSSLFLGWHVDFDKVVPESIVISSSDPRWLGAWWLGFLIAGVLAIAVSIFFICFPKSLPVQSTEEDSGKRNDKDSNNETGDNVHYIKDQADADIRATNEQNGFFVQLKSLMKNKVYVLELVASIFYCTNLRSLQGLFFPKIMEKNFGMSATQASLVAALVLSPGNVIGHLAGGTVVKRFKLSLTSCVKFTIGISVSWAIVALTLSFTICEEPQVVTTPGSCGASCACSENDSNFVCGADGRTYYSACAAGCTEVNRTENDTVLNYSSCACLEEGFWAVQGPCPWSCQSGFQLPLMIIASLLMSFFSSFVLPFSYQVYVRQVKREEKSLAMAIRRIVQRLLASIPAPVYFGAVVDSACVLWERDCGQRKSCWVYNNRNFLFRLTGLSVGVKLAEILFHSLAFLAMRHKTYPDNGKITEKRHGVENGGFEPT